MKKTMKSQLDEVLLALSKDSVAAVFLFLEDGSITWVSNVPQQAANAIAIQVGSALMQNNQKSDSDTIH